MRLAEELIQDFYIHRRCTVGSVQKLQYPKDLDETWLCERLPRPTFIVLAICIPPDSTVITQDTVLIPPYAHPV